MDSGLLARTDTDGLSVLYIADRIGLSVFQGDQGNFQVDQCGLRDLFIFGYNIRKQIAVNVQLVPPLLEGDSVYLLSLNGGRLIGGIDLDYVVISFFLGL